MDATPSRVDFHETQHDDGFIEDSPMSSSSPSSSSSAVDDSTLTPAATAVVSIEERDKEEVFSHPANKKHRLLQGEEIQAAEEAASVTKEVNSSCKQSKRNLSKKEHITPKPTKSKQRSKKNSAPRDWISHFAKKAFLATRKELMAAEKTEQSPTIVTVVSSSTEEEVDQPRKVAAKTTEKRKERNRKICSIETCTNQARSGGLCQRHGDDGPPKLLTVDCATDMEHEHV